MPLTAAQGSEGHSGNDSGRRIKLAPLVVFDARTTLGRPSLCSETTP